jgi:mRNA-degrading endonuclease RelE of RelBE toxin-antitoxin system
MNYSITVTSDFERSLKKLSKKYKSIKQDVLGLYEQLLENPYLGDRIGENFYKIRLAIKSKGRGKSGGSRVITYIDLKVIEEEEITEILLVKIYDKSDYESVGKNEINDIVSRHFRKIIDEE